MPPLCSAPISSTVLLTASTCNAVKNDYIFIQSWLWGEIFFVLVYMYVASPNLPKCGVNWQVLMWLVVAWCGRRVWHLSIWRTACACIRFHGQSQLSRSFGFSLARSVSSWIKSHWWRIDRIKNQLERLTLARRPFRMLTFPSGYTAKWALPQQQGGGCTQLARVYFWSEEDVWVGRKCAQLFFLY